MVTLKSLTHSFTYVSECIATGGDVGVQARPHVEASRVDVSTFNVGDIMIEPSYLNQGRGNPSRPSFTFSSRVSTLFMINNFERWVALTLLLSHPIC